jgi:hypothetical protein
MAVSTAAGQQMSACLPSQCAPLPPPDAGTTTGADASTPPQADSGVIMTPLDAGTVTDLRFAIVGDTRPPIPDDTIGYPKTIIGKIYQDIAAESPPAAFVVTTGDHMFAINLFGDQSTPQLDLYLQARAAFMGPVYYSLGNHECNSTVQSNCGPGAMMTKNYQAFLAKMMAPLGQTNAYYTVRYDATDGSWSAKFVIVAANAWNADQNTWLENELSNPTTYTFIVRHEPAAATSAPGVGPSEMIMARHPYTMALVGHTHTYQHPMGSKQLIVGTGGAPLTGPVNYGYVLASRRADGAIVFEAKDYMTGQVYDHFAVQADGSAAP